MGFYGNNGPMVSPYESSPAMSPYGNMPFSPASVSSYPCAPPVVKGAECGLSFVLVLFILLVIILRAYC